MGPNTVSPHRSLFLSVDRIDAVDARKSARGTRLVTGSEEAIVGGRGHTRLRAMPHMPIVQILRPVIRRGVGRTPRRERRRDRLLPRPQHRVPSERGVARWRAVGCGRASFGSAWHRSHVLGRVGWRPSHRASAIAHRRSRRRCHLVSPAFAAERFTDRGARARLGWTYVRSHGTFPRAANDRESARSPAT